MQHCGIFPEEVTLCVYKWGERAAELLQEESPGDGVGKLGVLEQDGTHLVDGASESELYTVLSPFTDIWTFSKKKKKNWKVKQFYSIQW